MSLILKPLFRDELILKATAVKTRFSDVLYSEVWDVWELNVT